LRTLLLGKAEMTLEEWDVLSKEIYEARKINDKKKSKIEFEKVVLKIEKNLELVGATALEDKVNLNQLNKNSCKKEFQTPLQN
jgi:hypothetical protein